MKIPFTWKQFERFWYLLSLSVIIVFLPFSKYLLSIGQMMMAGGWIVERFDARTFRATMAPLTPGWRILRFFPVTITLGLRGIAGGFRDFFRHKPALLFSSVFLMHLIGLLYTTDFDYAFKDLRTKLPILLLPLFFSTSRAIGRKTLYRFLMLTVAAVTVRTIYNTWMIASHNYIDIRDVSHNVSHIILGLLIALCLFSLGYFLFRVKQFPLPGRAVAGLFMIWLFAYLFISKSFTGIAVTALTLLILILILVITSRDLRIRVGGLTAFVLLTAGLLFSLFKVAGDYYRVNPVDLTRLDSVTSRGNRYIHNPASPQTENGNYLWIYVQWDEMRSEWNQRSRLNFDSLDMKNQVVAHTVVRFLTSKGWRKDGDAVKKLTDQEVTAIEKGIANYIFLEQFSIRGRIYEFLAGYEKYRTTGDPTGSTVMQRVEFWKASAGIIRDHWLTGVGTGDMNIAFRDQYEKMHTRLAPDQRWRSHNQYLSIWVGFGLPGLIWFLAAIFLPPVMMKRQRDFFIRITLIILALSMVTADTIETQTGVTFFTLFYSLFLFASQPGKSTVE